MSLEFASAILVGERTSLAFELPESLVTGVKSLDDDHRELVAGINAIAEAEQAADQSALLDRLTAFKEQLVEHFQSEEAYLESLNYPQLAAHSQHHSEIMVAIERLIRDVQNGDPVERVAHTCFHEVVSAVLLRDMQFLNWLADQRYWLADQR